MPIKNILTKQHVQNMLNHVATIAPELKDCTLVDADSRLGKRIALARISKESYNILTDHLTYSEMNQFLRGYLFKSENRLVSKETKKYFKENP